MLRIPLGSGDRDQTRVISGNRRKHEINGGFVVDGVEEAEELGVRARVSRKVSPIGNLFERPVRKYLLREFHLLLFPNDEYLHSTSSSRDNDIQTIAFLP